MAIEVDSLQESSSLHAAIHASLRKWAIVGVIATVDAMWIWHSSFSFSIASIRGPLILCMIVAPSAWSILIWRRNVGVFVFLDTVILLSVVTASCAVLSYLFMSIGRPLVDQYLSAADHVLGRNWLAYIQWMEEHPRLKRALEIAYLCWGPQWILIPLLLAPSQQDRVQELTSLGLFVVLVTIGISGVFPALAPYGFYFPTSKAMSYPWVHDILPLRDGSLRALVLQQLDGLISFPSFHTSGALLFIYVLRGRKLLFPIGVMLNITIIVSTISAGSHYFVDVIGGVALTAVSIVVRHGLLRYYSMS